MKTVARLLSRTFPATPSAHLAMLAACSLLWVAAGCKPGESPTPPTSNSPENTVVIRGSNTIGEELAPRLIAEFRKQHPKISFDLETKATGYGMAALRVGQCDIAAASRPAIEADLELAQEAKLEMNDHIIGAYSVAVVVNANNPVANLTKQQVHDIFTGKIANWKDVGGPDAAVHIYIRDPISGTHLGFQEIALDNEAYASHPKLATNYMGVVNGVASDPHGIGYAGFAMAKTRGVRAVSIDGVAATDATVHAGKYPFARVLRFYTNKASESQPTKDFIAFVLSADGQKVLQEMGFTQKP